MPLADLDGGERQAVFECLKCVAAGFVIQHDAEFQTIMGVEVSVVKSVVDAWPNLDDSDDIVRLVINNSMNNLLGYPHGKHLEWERYNPVPLSEVARIFEKWRGDIVPGA